MSATPSDKQSVPAAPPTNEGTTPQRKKLSGPRKWLYRLAAMTLIPALVFGLLEISLRVAGYGYTTDFFLDGTKLERPEVWIDNRDFGRWVFPRNVESGQPVPFILPKVKKPGTYRIFVFGESAAKGFPDPATSFARVLELMLRAQYPDTNFEIINAAMTGISSHIALPIARQCVGRKPDLFIVHLGNNEVVGPFGAAGVIGPFSPNLRVIRANIAVKSMRTGQLLDRTIQGLARQESGGQSFMATFAKSAIRADDSRLSQLHAHFRANLQDICRVGADAGVPVILCTIPVNLKDWAPFQSLHAADLDDVRKEAWEKLYRTGVKLESEKKFAEAIGSYQEAEKIDDDFADLAFRLGRCHAAIGNLDQARPRYVRACDLDALRFRSDSRINAVIREVAAANEAAGVRLADAERTFARNSPGELPGEELFFEHVHMKFKGNYLLARTVFETVTNAPPAALGRAANQKAMPLTEQQCAERLAQTEWNEVHFGTIIYDQLTQGPPFTFQLDHAARSARLKEKLAEARLRFQSGGYKQAIAQNEKALKANEADWMIRLNFGHLLVESGALAEAKEQYQRALVDLRHSFTAHYKIGALELSLGSPRAAEQSFRTAARIAPEDAEAQIGLSQALEGQEKYDQARAILEEQVRKHPARALALIALGRFLHRTGKLEEAKARLIEAVNLEPDNAANRVDLALVLHQQGSVAEAIEQFEAALQIQPDLPGLRENLAELRKRQSLK